MFFILKMDISRYRSWLLGAVVLASAAMQLGCNRHTAAGGQVVAAVNGDEISIHQLNFAVANTRKRSAGISPEAMLDTMIDRQLAVQQAAALGLDRNPDVMMRLEEVRLEALAAAYAAAMTRDLPAPTDEQVARFYREHPGLFAERRIYRLREVSVPVATPWMAELKNRVDKQRQPLADTMQWLRQQQVVHTEQLAMRPAEDLPLGVVDRLAKLQPGQTIAFDTPAALILYEVVATESAPISWEGATPVIRSHLRAEQERAHLQKAFARLREQSRIDRAKLPVSAERR